MTFTFKATDVRASSVKLLRYVAKTLLRPGSPPNSAVMYAFSNNCSCCTMHSNEVLKSLKHYAFDGDRYVATVILVFLCDIETVHFFCTKKPNPVLG